MTLVLGASHVVATSAIISIARPVGLKVTLSNIPNWVPRDQGVPYEYHRVGRVQLGNTHGYQPHIPLRLSPQVIYPIEPEFTLLAVRQIAGVTVTVDEIATSSSFPMRAAPWDRNPTPQINGYTWITTGGQNDTTLWSYTVPAGKIYRVTHATVWQMRTIAATTVAYPRNYITVAGYLFLEQYCFTNVLGAINTVNMGGGPLDLPAGTALRGATYNNDAGGQIQQGNHLSGYLFDA